MGCWLSAQGVVIVEDQCRLFFGIKQDIRVDANNSVFNYLEIKFKHRRKMSHIKNHQTGLMINPRVVGWLFNFYFSIWVFFEYLIVVFLDCFTEAIG